MPATRRSTRGAAPAARGELNRQQSTLSFNHRVTKGNTTKTGKDSKLSSPTPPPKVQEVARKVEVVNLEEQLPEEVAQPARKKPVAEKPEVQARAEKVSDAQIKRYWKGVEDARLARRVHQEEFGLPEKVLRYFDVSSQYGPCIGVPRIKRWYRAERLGLSPPIEVLAVLLKEEKQGNTEIDMAAMDRIMGSTAIGSI